jgi:hypothetical protein
MEFDASVYSGSVRGIFLGNTNTCELFTMVCTQWKMVAKNIFTQHG